MTTELILSILLAATVIIMAVLGIVSLARRRMNWTRYLGWGLLTVFVPLLGPFLVMCACPGEKRSADDVGNANQPTVSTRDGSGL